MGCHVFIKAISETMLLTTTEGMKNLRILLYLSYGSVDAGVRELIAIMLKMVFLLLDFWA